MKSFTYFDYIKCIHTLRLNAVFKIAEGGEKYNLTKEKEKKILKEKIINNHKIAELINKFLEPRENIEKENLIRCFDNKKHKFSTKKPDYIFFYTKQNLIFIIEEENEINDRVKYKMLNYCIDYMQECNRKMKEEKEKRYLMIIPIVIYTGKERVKLNDRKDRRKNISEYIFENYDIDFDYNLIDINKYN